MFESRGRIGCRQEVIEYSVYCEHESGSCGERFTKKSIERSSVYINHILAESDERHAWLQQDGAKCHTSRDSMEVLTEFFDDHVISKGLWPPRLTDV
ncbi:uncharacterized protein TNCV_150061 [Trichonephila clavipes]|nr:uncharacterized protein TNCV_150061 [Trichonephila clavipes]